MSFTKASLRVFRFKEIDSTNDEAKRRIRAGFDGQAVFYADSQTAGRGRQGKNFYSPDGTGLYMTVLWPTSESIENTLRVTAKTGTAVLLGIQSVLNIALSIKWVNDIYCGEKKVAGILVENVPSPTNPDLHFLVIGIGVNVSTADFPEELKGIAGSLGGKAEDREILGESILDCLIPELSDLRNTAYLDTYRARSCVIGREIVFTENGVTKEGLAVGIDDDGGLLVTLTDGERAVLSSGEITVRRKN